jgi:hypothetical protein
MIVTQEKQPKGKLARRFPLPITAVASIQCRIGKVLTVSEAQSPATPWSRALWSDVSASARFSSSVHRDGSELKLLSSTLVRYESQSDDLAISRSRRTRHADVFELIQFR